MDYAEITLIGERFLMLPEKAIYHAYQGLLILSDLHLGKINHFRKAGIAVPTSANNANTQTLIRLIMNLKPKRVLFIGDLFHSAYNEEWEVLGQIIKNFNSVSFELIPGNHDILSEQQYKKHRIKLHCSEFELMKNFILVHEPPENISSENYYLSGHIHPAVRLHGKGRQSLIFPCFWIGEQQAILPAFGVFTGLKSIRPKSNDTVFGIVNNQVILIDSSTTKVNSN